MMVKIRKDFIIKTDESAKLSSKVEEIQDTLDTFDNDPTNKEGDNFKSRHYGLMFDTTTTKYYVVFTDAIKTEYGISENYVEYGVNVDIDNKIQTLVKDTVNASKKEIQTALTTNLETKTEELQTVLNKKIDAQNTVIENNTTQLQQLIAENRGNFRGVVTSLPLITKSRSVESSSTPYSVPIEPGTIERSTPEEEMFHMGDIVVLETDGVFYIAGNDAQWYPISKDRSLEKDLIKLWNSGANTVTEGDTITVIENVRGTRVSKVFKRFRIIKDENCIETEI